MFSFGISSRARAEERETYRAISVCICAWICRAIIRIIITNNLVSVLRSVSICVCAVFVSFKCHCFLFGRMKRGSAIEHPQHSFKPNFCFSRFVFQFNSIYSNSISILFGEWMVFSGFSSLRPMLVLPVLPELPIQWNKNNREMVEAHMEMRSSVT